MEIKVGDYYKQLWTTKNIWMVINLNINGIYDCIVKNVKNKEEHPYIIKYLANKNNYKYLGNNKIVKILYGSINE